MKGYTATYDPETDFLTIESEDGGEYGETFNSGEVGVNVTPEGEVISVEVVNASQVFGMEPGELELVDEVAVRTEDLSDRMLCTVTLSEADKQSRYSFSVPAAAAH